MKIQNHLLFATNGKQVDFRQTPNKKGKCSPQYLVMHYTAATTAQSAINWFLRKEAAASAHLLIDRNGDIVQFAPFNVVTWHAGQSQWNGLSGLNKCSIGIELVNGGKLMKSGSGYVCPVDRKVVPASEVVQARHRNEAAEAPWQEYTEAQLETAMGVGVLLIQNYGLKDVLGHDDISPFRKTDPGPAFPSASFKARVMGRKDEAADIYKTNAVVNIRSGPATIHPTLTDPLPANTQVRVLKREGNWSFVEVLDSLHGLMDLEGWVFSKYLSQG